MNNDAGARKEPEQLDGGAVQLEVNLQEKLHTICNFNIENAGQGH